MRWVACLLVFLSGVLVLSCSSLSGTPMHGDCRNIPSVEACQAVADRYIEDYCLRDCIRHLCSVGKPKCDEGAELYCAGRQLQGSKLGGAVPKPSPDEAPRSCKQPREEINWCDRPLSSECQAQVIVHEYAHACGWHEGDGKGVPANNGVIACD